MGRSLTTSTVVRSSLVYLLLLLVVQILQSDKFLFFCWNMDLQWKTYLDLLNGHTIVNPHIFSFNYLKTAINFISLLPRPIQPPTLKLVNVNDTYINILP